MQQQTKAQLEATNKQHNKERLQRQEDLRQTMTDDSINETADVTTAALKRQAVELQIELSDVNLHDTEEERQLFEVFGIADDLSKKTKLRKLVRTEVAKQQRQQDDNVLGRGVYEKLTKAVCFFRDENSEAIGAGFAISETKVYSVSHNFVSPVAGMEVTCHFGKPNQHVTRKLQIVGVDTRLDFCVLETVGGERLLDFLAISTVPLEPGKQCILAAFQIGLQNDLKNLDPNLSVGIFEGVIAKLYPRHFVYQCPTFAGDSGGAIVLKDGQVIGIHQETVNQARERIERGEDLDTNSRLESVEASINDLIRSLSSGSIGLQLSAISPHGKIISGST